MRELLVCGMGDFPGTSPNPKAREAAQRIIELIIQYNRGKLTQEQLRIQTAVILAGQQHCNQSKH
jgi:hypothetical protein